MSFEGLLEWLLLLLSEVFEPVLGVPSFKGLRDWLLDAGCDDLSSLSTVSKLMSIFSSSTGGDRGFCDFLGL
jgi:hypothetical protein